MKMVASLQRPLQNQTRLAEPAVCPLSAAEILNRPALLHSFFKLAVHVSLVVMLQGLNGLFCADSAYACAGLPGMHVKIAGIDSKIAAAGQVATGMVRLREPAG